MVAFNVENVGRRKIRPGRQPNLIQFIVRIHGRMVFGKPTLMNVRPRIVRERVYRSQCIEVEEDDFALHEQGTNVRSLVFLVRTIVFDTMGM